jgi:hypothetical protein
MKVTRVRIILMACVLLLALALPLSTVSASPPIVASGTWHITGFQLLDVRVADGNTIIDALVYMDNHGDFEGPSVLVNHVVYHPNGSATNHGTSTFTGTFKGIAGTVVFQVAGHTTEGVMKGTSTVLSGTGGLANLHGVRTHENTIPYNVYFGVYSGRFHFDP